MSDIAYYSVISYAPAHCFGDSLHLAIIVAMPDGTILSRIYHRAEALRAAFVGLPDIDWVYERISSWINACREDVQNGRPADLVLDDHSAAPANALVFGKPRMVRASAVDQMLDKAGTFADA